MGHQDAPLSYEELLHAFKDALNRVLSGAVLPPTFATFDLTLTLCLLDIAHAVRQGRRTQGLVARACEAFAVYAADEAAAQPSSWARRPKLVT
jgi:hypothetical protein